jgi:N-acetylneuraminate synthase
MRIGPRPIGDGAPPLIIGEVAQAHDGSLGMAHAYVDAIADAGCDAVKFQTHIAAAESTPREAFRVAFSRQDATRSDYWRRMEFTPEQWRGLMDHAQQRGLLFLSSPFSFEAADLLEALGVPAWKVGSGEIDNAPFLRRLARTGRPVLLSSGLADWEALDRAVGIVRTAGADPAVFQCTTAYPCPPERLGLNVLAELRARYGVPVGMSDHSANVAAGIAAVALGADLVEVHVVFHRGCFGPDATSSLTPDDLRRLVDGCRFVHTALGHPVEKRPDPALRALFGRSVVARRDLPAGTVLRAEDLALKKPGGGLPPDRLDGLVGLVLLRDLSADEALGEGDVTPVSGRGPSEP